MAVVAVIFELDVDADVEPRESLVLSIPVKCSYANTSCVFIEYIGSIRLTGRGGTF